MTLGELLSHLLGWLGSFVAWLFNWVPRRQIIDFMSEGVHYPLGDEPVALPPGVHWWVPNRGRIVTHHVGLFTLKVNPITVETKDGIAANVGMSCTLSIDDILKYEVDNFSADTNMVQRAEAALRDIVMEYTWAELTDATGHGTLLEGKFRRRMAKALADFGVKVDFASPTDQVRVGQGVFRIFGIGQQVDVNNL